MVMAGSSSTVLSTVSWNMGHPMAVMNSLYSVWEQSHLQCYIRSLFVPQHQDQDSHAPVGQCCIGQWQ